MEKTMKAIIECTDRAEMLVFDRTVWAKDDELLTFSIMDRYLGKREYHGLRGRFWRAWRAFWEKPICYAEIVAGTKERTKEFLYQCLTILDHDIGGEADENNTVEETEQTGTKGVSQ